jgi:hypothetical protein
VHGLPAVRARDGHRSRGNDPSAGPVRTHHHRSACRTHVTGSGLRFTPAPGQSAGSGYRPSDCSARRSPPSATEHDLAEPPARPGPPGRHRVALASGSGRPATRPAQCQLRPRRRRIEPRPAANFSPASPGRTDSPGRGDPLALPRAPRPPVPGGALAPRHGRPSATRHGQSTYRRSHTPVSAVSRPAGRSPSSHGHRSTRHSAPPPLSATRRRPRAFVALPAAPRRSGLTRPTCSDSCRRLRSISRGWESASLVPWQEGARDRGRHGEIIATLEAHAGPAIAVASLRGLGRCVFQQGLERIPVLDERGCAGRQERRPRPDPAPRRGSGPRGAVWSMATRSIQSGARHRSLRRRGSPARR